MITEQEKQERLAQAAEIFASIHRDETVPADAFECGVTDEGVPYVELGTDGGHVRWEFVPGEAMTLARGILKLAEEHGVADEESLDNALGLGFVSDDEDDV